jgi:hypothetical protein
MVLLLVAEAAARCQETSRNGCRTTGGQDLRADDLFPLNLSR